MNNLKHSVKILVSVFSAKAELWWFNYIGNEKWEKLPSLLQEQSIKGIYKAKLDNNDSPDYLVLSSSNLNWLEYNSKEQ